MWNLSASHATKFKVPKDGFRLSEDTLAVPEPLLNAQRKELYVESLDLSSAGLSQEQAAE